MGLDRSRLGEYEVPRPGPLGFYDFYICGFYIVFYEIGTLISSIIFMWFLRK